MVARSVGIPKPVSEMEFAIERGRKFRFDFAWPGAMVAVEIEGGIFGVGKKCEKCGRRKGGAHGSVKGIRRDIEKYNMAALLGWRVLRFSHDQANDPYKFCKELKDAIDKARPR